MRRRERATEDEVIDLTDRLAPYADSALRPTERLRPQPADVEPEAPLWSPLDLGSLYDNR